MKQIVNMLILCLLLSFASLAAANGTITGSVYPPSTERGMRMAVSETAAGMMWDMSAPKKRKSSERAEVWLIERSINFNAIPYTAIQKWYQSGTIPDKQPIYHATVNDQGKFTFQDVPAADYYIMILDPHDQEINQNLSEKLSRDELLQKLPHTDEFELFMVGMRTCLVQKISLHNNQNLNIRPGVL